MLYVPKTPHLTDLEHQIQFWMPSFDRRESELTLGDKLAMGGIFCDRGKCGELANWPVDESARNRGETSRNRNLRGLEIDENMHGRSERVIY